MTIGYVVLVQYWNGRTYSVDFANMPVYSSRDRAEKAAKEMVYMYNKGDAMVDVVATEIYP